MVGSPYRTFSQYIHFINYFILLKVQLVLLQDHRFLLQHTSRPLALHIIRSRDIPHMEPSLDVVWAKVNLAPRNPDNNQIHYIVIPNFIYLT